MWGSLTNTCLPLPVIAYKCLRTGGGSDFHCRTCAGEDTRHSFRKKQIQETEQATDHESSGRFLGFPIGSPVSFLVEPRSIMVSLVVGFPIEYLVGFVVQVTFSAY
jgi:hypothetical protein